MKTIKDYLSNVDKKGMLSESAKGFVKVIKALPAMVVLNNKIKKEMGAIEKKYKNDDDGKMKAIEKLAMKYGPEMEKLMGG